MPEKPTYEELERRIRHLEDENTRLGQVENTLRAKENRYHSVLNASPDPIVIYDIEGRVMYLNAAFTRVFGWSLTELLNRRIEYVPDENRTETREVLKKMRAGKNVRFFETRRSTKDKRLLDIMICASPFRDLRNEPAGNAVFLRDVTEKKKTENALLESRNRYRSLYENAIEGMFQSTPDGRYINANPALAKIFGYDSPKNFLASITDISKQLYESQEDRKTFRRILEEKGKVAGFEARMRRRDGKTTWASLSARAVRDGDGNLLYYEGMHVDITRRKLAEEMVEKRTSELVAANKKLELEIDERRRVEKELKKTNRYLENVLDSSPDSITIVDEKGKFIIWNKAATELYGYTPEESRGMTAFDFYPDDKKLEKMLDELRRKGFVKGYEMDMKTGDGEVRPFEISIALLKDESRTNIGSVCVARDMSDLKKALTQAEAANKAKSDFLANMSHEIRTPMNAVIGFTELLETLVTDGKQINYLEAIKSGGKGLLTIINDILDLSKIEAGMLRIQYEPVNPRTVINEIKNIFLLKLSQKNLEFIAEIDPGLPENMFMDEVRLRQILLNLVGNAIKFTDRGFVKLSIYTIQMDERDSIDIRLAVEDTGIGIPEADQKNIFEPFRQQEGQDVKTYGGTGLGLAISRRLIEMMEGEISVISGKGKGARFEIVFRGIKVGGTPTVRPREKADAVRFLFEKATILAADDVKSNRALIRELFTDTDITLVEAENGEQALVLAREHMPDLILMDIMMPEMDGYETVRRIKSDDRLKHIPVIAVTAAFLEDEAGLKKLGFEDCLRKPVSRSSLFKMLGRFLKYSIHETLPEKKPLKSPVLEDMSKFRSFLEKLETELLPQWSRLKRRQPVGAAMKFGEDLIALGDEFDMEIMKQFGNELLRCIDDFDIENLRDRLSEFPELIEKLKTVGSKVSIAKNPVEEYGAAPYDQCYGHAEMMPVADILNEKKASRILIVDDNPKAIQLTGKILKKEGYEVEFATSGPEALEWAETTGFDLILLDVVMPEMDGFEVCGKLKTLPGTKDVPVIFLTAKTDTCDIVKGFQIGVVDYVTKPFNPIELTARVATHLELKFSRDMLRKRALMDGLTKLYNHSHIQDRLAQEIQRARRHKLPLSVIMLDLDHFKQINDTHGHKAGDEVLVSSTSLIKDILRKEDIAGRYGGEEFLVVLPNTDLDSASFVAEKIRAGIQNKRSGGNELSVTVSGGVCSLENEDANSLVKKADRLLYKAKKKGRNRVEAA